MKTLATLLLLLLPAAVWAFPAIQWDTVHFANLGTPANGVVKFCDDCAVGSVPCAGSGAGSFAERIGGEWKCNRSGATGSASPGNGVTTVVISTSQCTASSKVFVQTNWDTTVAVEPASNQFTVTFNTPAPVGAALSWVLY